MDANPWQVDSLESFYGLKCPECIYFTQETDHFREHAIENHPMSFTFFGKFERNGQILVKQPIQTTNENHTEVSIQPPIPKIRIVGSASIKSKIQSNVIENSVVIKEEPYEESYEEPYEPVEIDNSEMNLSGHRYAVVNFCQVKFDD